MGFAEKALERGFAVASMPFGALMPPGALGFRPVVVGFGLPPLCRVATGRMPGIRSGDAMAVVRS